MVLYCMIRATIVITRESMQITSGEERILAVKQVQMECISGRYVIAPSPEFFLFIKHAFCLFR